MQYQKVEKCMQVNVLGKQRIWMEPWKLFKEKDSSISLAKEIDFSLFL